MDSDSGVLYPESDGLVILRPRSYPDLSVRRGELDGVIKQVVQDLKHPFRVPLCLEPRQLNFHGDSDLLLCGIRAVKRSAFLEERIELEWLRLDPDLSSLRGLVIQQRIGHRLQTKDCADSLVLELYGIGFLAVATLFLEDLEIPVKDRQDRLEIVSRHGDQEPLVGALEPAIFQLGLQAGEPVARFLLELFGLQAQIKFLDGPRDRVPQDVRGDRLPQKIVGPLLQSFDNRFQRWRFGHKDEWKIRVLSESVFQEGQPGLLPDVQFRKDDGLPLCPAKVCRSLFIIVHSGYGIFLPGKYFLCLGKKFRIVVDEEKFLAQTKEILSREKY